jgi:DNA-binding winged helix-turn-helix (wHTH) protein/tetratricopeptide (TPR) repeat protein
MIEPAHLFGPFRFVPRARELWREGERVPLPRRTFECLEYLIAHRDRAVHRDELVEAIFHRPNVSDAQLGQVVLRTRRVIGDDGNRQSMIRTIAGHGYRWIAQIDGAIPEEGASDAGPADPPIVPTVEWSASPVGANSREATASASTRPKRPGIRYALASAAIALVMSAVVVGWMRRSASPPSTAQDRATRAERVVVLPMRVNGLREDGWVRLGAMDLVAERLREAGLGVPPSENVLGLLQTSGSPGDPDAAGVRAATGAQLVVQGDAVRVAGGWKVRLTAIPEHGIGVPVEFAATEAIDSARGAADRLLAALGRHTSGTHERSGELDETLQRARAALLANELETARSILMESPELGALPDRLAYWLAQVDFRAGRLDEADAALTRLLAKPETSADPHFLAQVLSARGATRTRRGAFAQGGADFDAALAALVGQADVLERGRARLGRANSRVAEHRYADALSDFGAARIDLESAGDLLGVARVDANLGMLELERGRPAAALGYLPAAADRFQAFGALHELLLTLTGLMQAQLAMLQRDEAWVTVERVSGLRERIADPDQRVDLLLNRAQVLMGNGRCREAEAALAQAHGMATSGNRVLLTRLRSLDAELAAMLERWTDAETATAAALADWPASGADAERSGMLLIRQRALLGIGRGEDARTLFDRTREAPREASDAPGTIGEAIAMAEWTQHQGDTRRASDWFAFANASADRRGVPVEIVAVAKAQAPSLFSASSAENAAAAIGRVAPWATRDYDAALLQLRLFHGLDQREPWFNALRQAQKLGGERPLPAALTRPRPTGS